MHVSVMIYNLQRINLLRSVDQLNVCARKQAGSACGACDGEKERRDDQTSVAVLVTGVVAV